MLTARDLKVLAFLQKHKAAPLDVVGKLFFARNAQTGATNARPQAAATRRLQNLARDGLVELENVREKGSTKQTCIIRPTAAASAELAEPPVKAVHGRSRDHHFASLRALTGLQEALESRGYVIERAELEHSLRGRAQQGGFVKEGDRFDDFPDAAIEAVTANGERQTIAIEYVTSKYTDASILTKAAGFNRNYSGTRWVVDNPRTAARVERLTGQRAFLAAPARIL